MTKTKSLIKIIQKHKVILNKRYTLIVKDKKSLQ